MNIHVERQVKYLKNGRVNIEDGSDYNGLRRLIVKRNLIITLTISALVCHCRKCLGSLETELEAYQKELAKRYRSTDPELELIEELLEYHFTGSAIRLIPVDSETEQVSKRIAAYTAPQKGGVETI